MPRPSLPALLVLIVSTVSMVHASLVAASGALAAQDATPVAPTPAIETLLTTTFPAEAIPTTSSPSFLIWYATIAPDREVVIPRELVACCPGPQIEHVLAGELTLRVEGSLQVQRGAMGGTPMPAEDVPPGTEVVLRPGDTAVYSLELPVTYHNAGTEPVHLVAGGFFAGSPPAPPADYAIPSLKERYPAPTLPPGPVTATLHRTTLAPEGVFPAPPSGAMQVVMFGPGTGTLGERSDGSVENLGREPLVVYALILHPGTPDGGTPAAN